MISNHVCIYFTSCVSGRERVGSIVVYSIHVVNSCYSLTQIINHQVKIQIKMKYFSLLLSIYTNRFLLLICSLLKSEKYYLIIILKYFYQCYFVLSLPFLYKNFIVITDIYVYSTSLPWLLWSKISSNWYTNIMILYKERLRFAILYDALFYLPRATLTSRWNQKVIRE